MEFLNVLILVHSIYDYQCCENHHCRPVPCEEISEDNTGWKWDGLHFHSTMLKQSPNSECHVCVGDGDVIWPGMRYPLCVYLPLKTS